MGGQKMITYLNTIFLGANPLSKVGSRNASELRCLAEALDALKDGELGQVADLLMSRFRAVEVASVDGNWDNAKHLDLSAQSSLGLTSVRDRMKAAQKELLQVKLEDLKDKLKKKASRG